MLTSISLSKRKRKETKIISVAEIIPLCRSHVVCHFLIVAIARVFLITVELVRNVAKRDAARLFVGVQRAC